MTDAVEVVIQTAPVEIVVTPPQPLAVTVAGAGVPGPRGAAGPVGGFEHVQSTPAGTWTISVPPEFGRRPVVGVYIGNESVLTDVTADAATVTITFPAPTAGSAVLS